MWGYIFYKLGVLRSGIDSGISSNLEGGIMSSQRSIGGHMQIVEKTDPSLLGDDSVAEGSPFRPGSILGCRWDFVP